MMKHKNKIIVVAVTLILLAAAFWFGGNAPGTGGTADMGTAENAGSAASTQSSDAAVLPMPEGERPVVDGEAEEVPNETAEPEKDGQSSEAKDTHDNTAVSESNEQQNNDGGQNTPPTDKKPSCTISVSCKTILDNMQYLAENKHSLVPPDGVILSPVTAEFTDGESVFNVLSRELKRRKIHLEFSYTPIYSSVYIEGINNLYEFDCGELSGWMYSVNGVFPNYGCSQYKLRDGDRVEWVYTCDLGRDVGGGDAAYKPKEEQQ